MSENFLKINSPYHGKEEAIKNLGGMASLYEKHLSRFRITYADSADKIKALLDQNDFENAQIMVHSIKGLTGTLGLTKLYHAAADLETAIKGKSMHLEPLLFIYDSCLHEILSDADKE